MHKHIGNQLIEMEIGNEIAAIKQITLMINICLVNGGIVSMNPLEELDLNIS